MENQQIDVIIVGAGIAGLTAAKLAKAEGKKILVIEASDGVGGRVRTDCKDGFLLDRGFQVLLTAYPAAKKLLDYDRLDLKRFRPGATILKHSKKYNIGDPFREPKMLWYTLFSPIGSLLDKLLLLKLKFYLRFSKIEVLFKRPEISTLTYLKQYGFSEKFIENFFRPFFSGIFLENELSTSSRMFEFAFKMFGEGWAAIPARGMGMISVQLAEGLEKHELVLNEKVTHIAGNQITTKTGLNYQAKAIVIATDALHLPYSESSYDSIIGKSALTLYFSSPQKTEVTQRIALNANEEQLINNIAFMDHISPSYAPPHKSLVSVSVNKAKAKNIAQLEQLVRWELLQWYPNAIDWQLLAYYEIPYALPNNETVKYSIATHHSQISDNCYICGDHLLYGSINAAMMSAQIAVDALLSSPSFKQEKQ